MISCLTYDKRAYEENFPQTGAKEKLRTCFSEMASAE